MTNREFFVAVSSSDVADELKQFALDSIAKLDAKNAKRSSADSKEKRETEARRVVVLNAIRTLGVPADRSMIAEATGLTPGQVTSACTFYEKSGVLKKNIAKVGKNRITVYEISEN